MFSAMQRLFAVIAAVSVILMFSARAQAQEPAPAQGGYRYTKMAPFPEPDEELYGLTANGKMYVLGGFGPGGAPKGIVYEYDPGVDKWTKKKDFPVPVHHQAQASYNGKIYVFGGCLKQISGGDSVDNSWEYDPVADSWKALAPMPIKRCSGQAEEVNGKIYVIGGMTPMENGKPGTRVSGLNEAYDPATNKWEERSPMPTTRNHAFSGMVNGKIYMIGGRQASGGAGAASPTDVVEEYDPAQDLWGPVKSRMITPRSGGGSATYKGRIYTVGGEETNRSFSVTYRAVEAYEPATNTWVALPPMPVAKHGQGTAFLGNKLHLASGVLTPGSGRGTDTDDRTAQHDVLEIPDK
jgi:N-acetylneuraminic acid mutarotase